MKKCLPSLINIYFYVGYIYSILSIVMNMTTTILSEFIDRIPFINIFSYIHYYLTLPYGMLFNESLITVPHQVYSTVPVIPELLFYSILLLIFILYIFILDNLRKIVVSLVTEKFNGKLINTSLLKMAITNFVIYFISLTTTVAQDFVSSGSSLGSIISSMSGLFAGSIFFGIVCIILRVLISRQTNLQKEIDEIV